MSPPLSRSGRQPERPGPPAGLQPFLTYRPLQAGNPMGKFALGT